MWPYAFHATHAPVSLFPCSPHHRAPGMEAESTSGGSKERPFFSSIYRAYMHFLMQENEKRHDSRATFDWRMSVADLREAIGSKDPGADRGRAVGQRSRAIAGTFVVATCAAFVAVSVARSSVAT